MTLDELYIYAEDREIEVDDFSMRELVSASFPEGWIAIDTKKIKTKAEEKITLAKQAAFITYTALTICEKSMNDEPMSGHTKHSFLTKNCLLP